MLQKFAFWAFVGQQNGRKQHKTLIFQAIPTMWTIWKKKRKRNTNNKIIANHLRYAAKSHTYTHTVMLEFNCKWIPDQVLDKNERNRQDTERSTITDEMHSQELANVSLNSATFTVSCVPIFICTPTFSMAVCINCVQQCLAKYHFPRWVKCCLDVLTRFLIARFKFSSHLPVMWLCAFEDANYHCVLEIMT